MNTRRENRLEELGRVDAEKAYTSKGKKNLKQEKSRIRKELNTGGRSQSPDYARRKLTPPGGRGKVGPRAARPVPKSLRDKLRDLYKKREGKQSPGRPGGKGPKPDKRWNKGDKFMTPLRKKLKDGSRPRPQGPQTWVKSGIPKLAKKGWK